MDIHQPTTDLFSAAGLVIVITGGGTGIGLAMTAALARSGAQKIYILGRRVEVLVSAIKEISAAEGLVVPIQCDVSDPKSIAGAAAQVEQETGYLDVLINNAGVSGPDHKDIYKAKTLDELQSIMQSDHDGWATTLSINTTSVVSVSAAFLKLLDKANARRGFQPGKIDLHSGTRTRSTPEDAKIDRNDVRTAQIITVASISGFNRHVTAGLPYCASKAGAILMGKSMANFLAPWGIRSNLFCPGLFPSEMNMAAANSPSYPPNLVPELRAGNYNDVAGTILTLVGQGGAYLNGAVQVVDGGRLSMMPATF